MAKKIRNPVRKPRKNIGSDTISCCLFSTIHRSIYQPEKDEQRQGVQMQHQKKAVDRALSVPVTDANTAFELQETKRLATEKG